MKPFNQITRRGRIRRFRQLAQDALRAYGLTGARLTFLAYEGNVIYRVDTPKRILTHGTDDLYHPHRYILRVHMDYHSTEAIKSELQWLSALRRDIDLPVPEPVPTSKGELVIELPVPGYENTRRKCSLLRWVNGRFISKQLNAHHVQTWGRLMARLHEHASKWKPPRGLTRPVRDWDGLFSDSARFEFPAAELRQAMPDRFRKPFESVTRELRKLMSDLGTESDAFGLVHADLNILTNIIYHRGEARVIDFDDCAFAYWLHDLAFALSYWQADRRERWVRDAFLNGYLEIRTLPDSQLKHLDLFIAGFNANLMLWMLDWAKLRPDSPAPITFVNKYGNNLLRYHAR